MASPFFSNGSIARAKITSYYLISSSLSSSPSSMHTEPYSIPSVDLGPYFQAPFPTEPGFPSSEQLRVSSQIDDTFRRNGFLIISNIGMSTAEVTDAFGMARSLFELTATHKNTKLQPFNNETNQGYRAVGHEVVNKSRAADIREVCIYLGKALNVVFLT